MIFLGIGSNLPTEAYGGPEANCRHAVRRLAARGLVATAASRLYATAPVPASDQPWFVNCVIAVATRLEPQAALAACFATEAEMGRRRTVRNAPRIVDIDIVAWDERVIADPDLAIPHPRLAERAFVLHPLADVAPGWRHPVTGRTVEEMIAALPPGQAIEAAGPFGPLPAVSDIGP